MYVSEKDGKQQTTPQQPLSLKVSGMVAQMEEILIMPRKLFKQFKVAGLIYLKQFSQVASWISCFQQ